MSYSNTVIRPRAASSTGTSTALSTVAASRPPPQPRTCCLPVNHVVYRFPLILSSIKVFISRRLPTVILHVSSIVHSSASDLAHRPECIVIRRGSVSVYCDPTGFVKVYCFRMDFVSANCIISVVDRSELGDCFSCLLSELACRMEDDFYGVLAVGSVRRSTDLQVLLRADKVVSSSGISRVDAASSLFTRFS